MWQAGQPRQVQLPPPAARARLASPKPRARRNGCARGGGGNTLRERGGIDLVRAYTDEAHTALRWLEELGRGRDFIVLDGREPGDPDLLRVYVGHSALPHPRMPKITDLTWRFQ